ncbi:MAG: biotin transporter BioY [Sedimentisphaerales bacterium]|nr:biotin transporter BioY [Sedimentisphaerales bacterium]
MMLNSTVADVFRPRARASAVLYDAIVVICGSLVVALSAQIRIYLAFSPVPITAQTFAVLMLGALLGSRRGGLAMLVYLVEGALGLPVFAAGVGLAALFGPTGGYLVGFVAAAYLVGKLAERGWDRRIVTTVAAMIVGNAVLHLFGFTWLAVLTDVKTAFITGVYPFILGDLLKVALAAAALPTGWKLLGRLKLVR